MGIENRGLLLVVVERVPQRLICYTDHFDDLSLLRVIEVTVKLEPDIPG